MSSFNRPGHALGNAPTTPSALRDFADQYSEAGFWTKLSRVFRRAGYELVEKALWLHYAARQPDTPRWARVTAYGALAYFILPFDAVPDWLFGIGFTDDLGAITLAVATISQYIDDSVKRQSRERLDAWFGPKTRYAESRDGAYRDRDSDPVSRTIDG